MRSTENHHERKGKGAVIGPDYPRIVGGGSPAGVYYAFRCCRATYTATLRHDAFHLDAPPRDAQRAA